ncbi:MAG: S8 family peptidase [Actinomycetota bacterium]
MARSRRPAVLRFVLVTAVAFAVQAALTVGASALTTSAPARSYIVVLKPGAAANLIASDHAARFGADVRHVYRHALTGYAARIPAVAVSRIASDPRVALVEPDGLMRADTTQTNATWGLDRIDQRSLPLSTTYGYTNTGSGVTAYILDTGMRFSHQDFGGRAVSGHDFISNDADATDCNGHGTHTGGTVGGSTYGVAKQVKLVAVRVLDCSGSGATSVVIAGVDWVTGNHQPGQPAVANMSLGGGTNSALDTAVKNSIDDGVAYSLSAGNGNLFGQAIDACNQSPARVGEAMTISATNKQDSKPRWANYGNCVDWFAPGVGITSAWYSSDTATAVKDGTSMAAPHNAGVSALYLQANPSATPAQVRDALFALTTKDKVGSSKTAAHNDLLFTNL